MSNHRVLMEKINNKLTDEQIKLLLVKSHDLQPERVDEDKVRDIQSPEGPFKAWLNSQEDNTTEFKKIYSEFQNTSSHKIDSSPTKSPNIKSSLHVIPDLEINNKRKAGSPIKQYTTENKKVYRKLNDKKPSYLSFKDESQLELNYQNWLLLQEVEKKEKLLEFMKLERKFEQEI